ncbi:MAG: hypothetical protein ACUVWP_00120 [bacterium]
MNNNNIIYYFLIPCLIIIFLNCEQITETGTIKGTVYNDDLPAGGVYVLLLDSGKLLEADQPLNNGSITKSNGNYAIYLVEPDKYLYVVAVKDNNGDLKFTLGVDEFGYYGDWNGIKWIPTEVKVGRGQVLEGIDIEELY